MTREILSFCDLQVIDVVRMPDGGRIAHLSPYSTPEFPTGKDWPDIELANHNVFRLDAHNQVVWQVQRVEWPGTPSWEVTHERAKQRHAQGSPDGAYTAQGFLDPFTHMQLGDGKGQGAFAPDNIWRPGYRIHLLTRWTSYVLDPETGVATSTGDQLK